MRVNLKNEMDSITAFLLCGGKGERLRPHTYVLPKPIMPLGDSTLLETNIRWLCKNNVTKQKITLGYLGHLIEAIVGNGSQFGADIDYYNENNQNL